MELPVFGFGEDPSPSPTEGADLTETLREIEALREKAYREGYEEGFRKGREDGEKAGYEEGRQKAQQELAEAQARLEANFQKKIQDLDRILQELRRALEETVLDLDKEILHILEKLAEKFLLSEIPRDRDLILRVIRAALEEVVEGARITVRVHPSVIEMLQQFDLRSLSSKNFPKIELKPDPSISPGGCLLETSFGLVDATVERRWEEILKALREAAESEG